MGVGDKNKLLMTSFDCGSSLIIRMERVDASSIHDNNVFYAARGPFQGIFLSNPGTSYVEPTPGPLAAVTLEAVLEDMKAKDMGSPDCSFLENRTLRFWFEDDAQDESSVQGNVSVFLSDLLQASDFPKDYGNFIKKMLVVLQRYAMIARVEMELTYPEEEIDPTSVSATEAGEAALGHQRYITLTTPANGNHYYIRELATQGKSFVSFRVKAPADAHVALSEFFGDPDTNTFEVVLGADSNSTSYIGDSEGRQYELTATPEVLNEDESRPFWIAWSDTRVEVGKGTQYGEAKLMSWRIPDELRHAVNHMGVSTGQEGPGTWEFIELADVALPDDELAVQHAETKVKTSKGTSVILMAKKARMLESLENAYPNSLTTDDLLRMHQIKPSDRPVVRGMLAEMKEQGVIREVDENRWIRNMAAEHEEKHETLDLNTLNNLHPSKQPTIALITTLFAEKLAVDAMMENKVSYVQYKTQGESTIYTIGSIGRFFVVCTKLPRVGAGRSAQISAGNTMTRLLGSFKRVEHVLLVGVGGGVPEPSDFSRHVRRGDVVVSYPADDSGAVYLNCDKVEKTETRALSFMTRSWQPDSPELLQAFDRVFSRSGYGTDWERYVQEGMEVLKDGSTQYYRPASRLDRVYVPEGSELVEVAGPVIPDGVDPTVPRLLPGPIGSGRYLTKELSRAREFAVINSVKAYDVDFSAVLESLAGNRLESFLVLRGVADYSDGSRGHEWQPYAALVAAAAAKALVLQMVPPEQPSPPMSRAF